MKTPHPTKNAERGAPTKRQFTDITGLLALHSTINGALLRAWCASPSRWCRATFRTGASHTTSEAVDLPDSEVFSRPKFKVLDVGSAYPQGRRQRFGAVTTPHIHSVALVRRGMVFVPPEGAKTMTTSPMASRRAAPASPTFDPIATHFEAVNAAAMSRWYAARYEHTKAARKATQALSALRKLIQFERAEKATTSASPCAGCIQNFALPDGPLDFFDAQVVRGYIELRTACTERAGAAKPCLKGGA